MSQASADDAVTIILDAKRKVGSMAVDTVNGKVVNEVYYFFGKPLDGENPSDPATLQQHNNLQKSEFLADEVNSAGVPSARGIRKIIQERNKDVLKKIEELKKQFREGKIDQAKYDELAKQVRKDENLKKPVVIIKSTPEASYGALVEVRCRSTPSPNIRLTIWRKLTRSCLSITRTSTAESDADLLTLKAETEHHG